MANRNAELIKAARENNLQGVKEAFYTKTGLWSSAYAADADACDDEGNTALSMAASRGYRPIVQFLLTKRANFVSQPNKKGETPLMLAAKGGYKAIMQDLMANGAKLTEKNNEGVNVLMYAADNKQGMVVRFIIEQKKVDLNQKDNVGRTAVMHAVRNGDDVSLQILLGGGASMDLQDESGKTAVMYAAENGDDICLQTLLDHGAAMDLQDDAGETALMKAWARGKNNALTTLLNRGAKIDIRDNQGKKFHEMSVAYGYGNEVKKVFSEFMKRQGSAPPEDVLKAAFKKAGIDLAEPEHWTPIGDVAVEQRVASIDSPKVLSTVFNFESRQYVTAVQNILTGEKEKEASGDIGNFPNQDLVVAAYKKLLEMGKKPPELKKSFPL